MNKRYARYFGKNIVRIIYAVSCGLLCYGCFNIVVGNSYWGLIYCMIGLIPFFLTSHIQVSDKAIDELIETRIEKFKEERLKDIVVGKTEITSDKFSTFSGFIRDGGDVRFKRGRDEKIRTSRYFITAVAVDKKEFTVVTSVYDMLSDERTDKFVSSIDNEIKEFSKESMDFPQKLHKCRLLTVIDGEKQEFVFYLPSDALSDKLIVKIDGIVSEKEQL